MAETDAEFLNRYWTELNWDTDDADFDRLFALARRGAAVQDLPSQIREAEKSSPYAFGKTAAFLHGLSSGYEAAAQIVESALPPPPEKDTQS